MSATTIKAEIDALIARAEALPWYANSARLMLMKEVERLTHQYLQQGIREAFERNGPVLKKLFSEKSA